MIYLSKGIVQKGSTEQLLFVLYGGQKFELTGNAAAAWLNGRFKFAEALGRNEAPAAYLQKLGLVETEADNDGLSRYRIASRCIFCPADTTGSSVLRAMDKEILQWLKNAGVRLTVAELVYLIENGIKPTQDLLHTDMTPYSTEPPEEYKEFADMTEELKADYARSVDCLKLPNGKIVECGSYPYFSKYSIVDEKVSQNKVSQNKVGPLHHTRRTKQSRKIQYLPNYPRQKVYKTFEKYAEDYRGYEYNKEEKRYGFYCNPNAMWDWYQIGGRWPVTFLVKADCTEYSFGERSWGNYSKKYPAPEGYMWVSAARKKDICWDVMRSWYIAQDTERYTKLKEAFQCGKLPDEFHGEFRENGFFCCGKCAYAAGETLDEYLARIGTPKSWKYPIGVSDIVDADDWFSKNDISIGKESSNWHEQIDTYIDDLDGEDVLVSVDYHM